MAKRFKELALSHASHKCTEGLTRRRLANMALRAMSALDNYDNGTIRNPFETASTVMPDGRELIAHIYEDGYVRYNNGAVIVEVDEYSLYVDFVTKFMNDNGIEVGEIDDDFKESELQENY